MHKRMISLSGNILSAKNAFEFKKIESFLYFYLFTNTFRAVPQPFAFWVSINASNNACK